jgi:hypothetical protein
MKTDDHEEICIDILKNFHVPNTLPLMQIAISRPGY